MSDTEGESSARPLPRRIEIWVALIGLLGVLVGALVTSGFGYLHDRQQEALELRTAKREIVIEIEQIEGGLTFWTRPVGANSSVSQVEVANSLPTAKWEAHEDVLARGLSAKTWQAVASWYVNVEDLRHAIAQEDGRPPASGRDSAIELLSSAGYVLRQLHATNSFRSKTQTRTVTVATRG